MLDNDPKGDHNKRQVKEKQRQNKKQKNIRKRVCFRCGFQRTLAGARALAETKANSPHSQHPSQNQYY
jgi:hypothetical protein